MDRFASPHLGNPLRIKPRHGVVPPLCQHHGEHGVGARGGFVHVGGGDRARLVACAKKVKNVGFISTNLSLQI